MSFNAAVCDRSGSWCCANRRGLERIAPVLGGWAGVDRPYHYDGLEHDPLPDAGRFAQTNLSPVACGAFGSALELAESVGIERIEALIAHKVDLLLSLLDENGTHILSPRDRAQRAGIVVVFIPEKRAVEAHALMTAQGISCTVHGDDRIRLSLHATTPSDSLHRTAETIRDFISK